MPEVTIKVTRIDGDAYVSTWDFTTPAVTTGTMSIGSFFSDPYGEYIGILRFNNALIPVGATIQNAYIEMTARTNNSNVAMGLAVTLDKAQTPILPASALEMTSLTTSIVSSPVPANVSGPLQSGDLKTILQEVIDLPGWASGNTIQAYLRGQFEAYSQQNAQFDVETYDTYTVEAPRLVVTYTESGAPTEVNINVTSATATANASAKNPTVTAEQAPATTTVTFQIATGADDGRVWSSDNSFDNTFYYAIASDDSTLFFRFTGISIPKGATITSANLTFDAYYDTNSAPLTIKALASDNAPRPTTASAVFAVDNTLSTTWNTTAWSTPKQRVNSSDIKTLIQAIVNRSGWASGNAMLFTISGTSNAKYFFMYEGTAWDSGNDHCPKLTITYTEAPASTSVTIDASVATATTTAPTPTVTTEQAPTGEPVEIVLPMSLNANDGYYTQSTIQFNSMTIGWGNSMSYHGWMSWTGVDIPQGATITNAYLRAYMTGDTQGFITHIDFNKQANPPVPTSGTVASLLRTPAAVTAGVAWNFLGNGWVQSPDLSAIVQELIDLPAWTNGNNMLMRIVDDGGDYGHPGTNYLKSFSAGGTTNRAELHITYAIAQTGTSVVVDVPLATATATAPTASVATTQIVNITSPQATATAEAKTPQLSHGLNIEVVKSTAYAESLAPTVVTIQNAVIESVVATASATALTPVVEALFENGVIIERHTGDGNWTPLTKIALSNEAPGFDDADVVDGTTYYYRIKRVTDSQETTWSEEVSHTFYKPLVLSGSPDGAVIRLHWVAT